MQRTATSSIFKAASSMAKAASNASGVSSSSSASSAVSSAPSLIHSASSSSRPLMRMRIRVNCAGQVQTSEFAFIRGFHSSRRSPLKSSYVYGAPSAVNKSKSAEDNVFFPQVYSEQGSVSVAGSNVTYESFESSLSSSSSKQSFSSEENISGPTNTTYAKFGHSE